MNNCTFKQTMLWCITLLIGLLSTTPAFAFPEKNHYFYRATVKAQPTAGGKVYVSKSATNTPSYQTVNNQGYSITGNADTYAQFGTTTLYWYAQENDGYIFDHWAKGSATGDNVSSNNSFYNEETFNSQNSNNPTPITYVAVFTKQTGLVKVQVAEAGRGTVAISKSDNVLNDEVTLTANPDAANGVVFLGWNKSKTDNVNFISTSNPYTLTVTTETEGTYYAHFSEAMEKMYVRLRNNQTGRFLSLYGDAVAGTHRRTYKVGSETYNDVADGFIFENSLKMVSAADAQGNPMTVFLRNGNPMGTGVTINADMVANDVQFSHVVSTDYATNKYPLTMETTSSGAVRIYTTYTTKVENRDVTFRIYLCDENNSNGWVVMKSIEDLTGVTGLDWTIYTLDESKTDGALGANTKAKYTKDNMYYTTMYTYFPYKLLDGVKAYYLPMAEESYDSDNNRVVFTELTSGIVPPYTAVVLECQDVQNTNGDVSGVKNRILPLMPEAVPESDYINPSYNLLKGYISMNGNVVANNNTLMYVLSTKEPYGLGFYHYTGANMSANKAYLELPEAVDEYPQANSVTFRFGQPEETPTSIALSNLLVDEADGAVFDLQGRKVAESILTPLPRGIYITKGKKFTVK